MLTLGEGSEFWVSCKVRINAVKLEKNNELSNVKQIS